MARNLDTPLFRGTAWFYARYRPGIPESVISLIIKKFQPDRTGRLLDLGCGTGQMVMPLAPYFKEVVGLDPDPEMLAEAQRQTVSLQQTSIVWVLGSSNELANLASQLGLFHLVTVSRAFHWMNQAAVLQVLAGMVAEGGGIVVIGDGSLWTGQEHWQVKAKEVIQRWLGQRRRAGSMAYFEKPEPYKDIFARSAFNHLETYEFPEVRTWTTETILGYLYSTSFASRRLLGDYVEAFEQDLRQTLLDEEPSSQFIEHASFSVLVARRVG